MIQPLVHAALGLCLCLSLPQDPASLSSRRTEPAASEPSVNSVASGEIQPRVPLDAGPVTVPVYLGDPERAPRGGLQLAIKLVDAVRGRATEMGLISLAGADLTPVRELALAEGLSFRPLLSLSEEKADALLARAEARSGQAQPDLLGMLVVTVPSDDQAELVRVGEALRALPQVEYAHIQVLGCPPPGDISPTTPDHSSNQDYVNADPGLNAVGAWSQGVFGAGVRLSDCEYGWDYDHEEYNSLNLNPEPGQTIHPNVFVNDWDDHGTAVLGETVATDNGYGVTGFCPGVTTYTFPEWTIESGYRRADAIDSAIMNSLPGDVVLLEMQTINFGNSYGPAELDLGVFIIVKVAAQSGIVIVGAAGNGNQDLDGPTYATYQGWGDSGAILVGAGTSDTNHDKLWFSTYGSRVDVQGWGEFVFSTGYGNYALYGGDEHQSYTNTFSGTSSASAMVAGVVALVQAQSIVLNGVGLSPWTVRQLLKDTGIPQGTGGNIGPLPDAGAAVAGVGPFTNHPWIDLGLGLAGIYGEPVLTPEGPLVAGSPYKIDLTNAAKLAPCWLVVGFTNISAPFKGGILVPSVDLLFPYPLTSLGGALSTSGTFPPGVPPGIKLYFQWWVADSAGPQGYSASNAVEGTTQ